MARLSFKHELAPQLDVVVFFTTTQLDTSSGRDFLPSGDVFIDVFNRTLGCPFSSRFLEEAALRLRTLITRWYQREQVHYSIFIRREMGFPVWVILTYMSAHTTRGGNPSPTIGKLEGKNWSTLRANHGWKIRSNANDSLLIDSECKDFWQRLLDLLLLFFKKWKQK